MPINTTYGSSPSLGQVGVPAPGNGAWLRPTAAPAYSNQQVGEGYLPKDAADPAVLRDPATGIYFAYATQDAAKNNTPLYASYDLVHWQFVADAMPSRPKWTEGDIWAPQTVKTGDHYTMFYSGRDHNGMMNIGYAVSPSPAGPFQDKGIAIPAPQYGPDNNPGVTIDPNFFQDPSTGKTYLYWGSANGDKRWFAEGTQAQEIKMLGDGTLERIGEPRVVKPKLEDDNGIVEGAWVEKHGNQYYMFYSDGDYKGDAQHRYHLNVARSSSPLGPFTEHRRILSGAGRFINPGHNSTVTDDAGQEWAVYHASKDTPGYQRQMMLDKIEWGTDGWPSINDGHPSTGAEVAPYIDPRRFGYGY